MTASPAPNRWWWAAVLACAAGTLYLSVIPIHDGPDVPYLDKAFHLCNYLLFAWLLVQAIHAGRLQQREYLLLAWVYAFSYGLLIEVIQGMLPWRSADWADALANAAGAAAGVWLGRRLPRPS